MFTPRNFSNGMLSYGWSCAKCETIATQSWQLLPKEAIPLPMTPTGWTQVEARFYCPDHSVQVLVDGETRAL